MATNVPLSCVDIMSQLDALSKEYSDLLTGASEAKVSVLRYNGGHDKLVKMLERLEALEAPIRGMDEISAKEQASKLLTCLANAITSSLYYPTHHMQ